MTTTHSAAFIAEMKERLIFEQRMLREELERIGAAPKEGAQVKFPEYGEAEDENAQEVADFQALSATARAAQERLTEVEGALGRLEAGKYGVTADGEAIPEERLRANPAAATLVHASK